MAKWRDRRPSDYDIPSTDDVLRRLRRGGDKKAKPHHVVVRDGSDDEESASLTGALVLRDWLLVILVCLVLILQIWQMLEKDDVRTPSDSSGPRDQVAGGNGEKTDRTEQED